MQPGSKHQYPFTPPRYVEETAEPYIIFYAWHLQQEKKKRIRVRVDGSTAQERSRNGARLVREFSKKLSDGWHISEPDGFQPPVKVAPTANDLDPNLSVVDAFAIYRKVKAKELRESTLDLYENYLNHLNRFLTDTRSERFPLRKLNKTIITQFLDQLTVGGRFQNNLVGWLKSFFDFWIDDRPLLKEHPMPKVKKLRVDESDDHKPFNAEQAREIRPIILEEYKDEQLWLFCQFAYYLFLRPGNELRLLKVGDLLADQVKVISGNSKNRRVGFVDIPTSLQAEIERLGLRGYPPHYYLFNSSCMIQV